MVVKCAENLERSATLCSTSAKLFNLGAWAYLIAVDQTLPVVHPPRVPDAALYLTERRTVAEEDSQLRPVRQQVSLQHHQHTSARDGNHKSES